MISIDERAGRFDEVVHLRVVHEEWNKEYTPHCIYASRNGYQWSGLSVQNTGQLTVLRDMIDEYLKKCHEEGIT